MHPSDDDLKLFSLSRLPNDETKSLQLHLLGCESCQRRMRRLTQASASARFERRDDDGIEAMSPIPVRVLDAAALLLQGWLLEITKSSLTLLLLEPLHPNTLVQIRLGKQIIMAQVRFCRPLNSGYEVGFDIQDVFMFPRQNSDDVAR